MSFFPDCSFRVELDGGAYVAGRRNTGRVTLVLPEAVPRAERLEITFQGEAVAAYGTGKNRRVARHTFFDQRVEARLPPGGLAAGSHVIPFALDVPAGLAQAYRGDDCHIEHRVDLRLDVDWAIDPTMRSALAPTILPSRTAVAMEPVALRTPPDFHGKVCVELTLASRVVARGQPLRGMVALRTGHGESFSTLRLILVHFATIVMDRGDSRPMKAVYVELPVARLQRGESISFRLPTDGLPVDQRTGMIDLASSLRIELDPGILSSNRAYDVRIVVLPAGSPVSGSVARVALGTSRLQAVATALAAEMGGVAGPLPVLVRGEEAKIGWSLEDAAEGTALGARVALALPSLGLGLRVRPEGLFTRDTEETPAALRATCRVKSEPASPEITAAHVRAFLERACIEVASAREIELSDHRLAYRVALVDDGLATWRELAQRARRQAAAMASAIEDLPFGAGARASEDAWRTAAAIEGALFVPSLPAIVGVVRSIAAEAGEPRSVVSSVGVGSTSGKPWTRLEVRLADVLLPEAAVHSAPALELAPLRGMPVELEVISRSAVVALVPDVVSDPRPMLDAIEIILTWMLEIRGERRVYSAYR